MPGTKKSWFGELGSHIKDALVEEVPDPSAEQSSTLPAPPTTPPSVLATAHPSFAPTKAGVDQAARLRLEQAVAQAAPAGYTEIMDTISELSDSIPDEGSRVRAALKLAKKHGHGSDDILGDVDKCIGILEAEGRKFQDEIKRQTEKKVGARQTNLQALDESIKSKRDQITALQQEISQLSEQRGNEAAAITSDTARIQAVSEGFEAAYDAVMEQIVDRRKKIEIYGKAGQS